MPSKSQKSRMHSVVEAISQYLPSFPEEIRGCTPEEISSLQAAVGRPLPTAYVEYLQCMGHHTGSLVFYESSDFSFETMLRIHTRREVLMPPERFLMFGVAEDDPYYNFHLDCGTPEPQVVRFPMPETAEEFPKVIQHLDWLASSLYELVFSRAYLDFHLPGFSQQVVLAEDDSRPLDITKVEAVLAQLGLARHPQSTATALYFERPALAVVLIGAVGAPWALHVAAHERREGVRVSDILAQRFHLLPTS